MIPSVVILAGGLATRLKPITNTIPKSLIQINNTPFIIHQLKLLKKNKINRVHFCLGHLGEMVEEITGEVVFEHETEIMARVIEGIFNNQGGSQAFNHQNNQTFNKRGRGRGRGRGAF